MSKAKRNRAIRKQALAAKESHPSDPRDTASIARCIRKNGRVAGSRQDESILAVPYTPKLAMIKGGKHGR